MEYNNRFKQENTARIIELISEFTDISKDEVNAAVEKYDLQHILQDPTLISANARDKTEALKAFIEYLDQEG